MFLPDTHAIMPYYKGLRPRALYDLAVCEDPIDLPSTPAIHSSFESIPIAVSTLTDSEAPACKQTSSSRHNPSGFVLNDFLLFQT